MPIDDSDDVPAEADDEPAEPDIAGVLHFELSSAALGHDYPATAISAEIGRVAIAAARVDQEYALLLSALHAGRRADWDFEDLRRRRSAWLRETSLHRVRELFEEQLLEQAHDVVRAAYSALDQRHVAMHSVWTLTGPDAMTSVPDLVAALGSPDPDAALAALVGRDVDSDDWRAVQPRTGGPGPNSVVQLRSIRRELEHAQDSLFELRLRLASALYVGKPTGARRVVVDPDAGKPPT